MKQHSKGLTSLSLLTLLLVTAGCKSGNYDYCDVQSVLEEKCVICHSSATPSRAPFPLETYDEIKAHASDSKRAIRNGSMPIVDRNVGSSDLTKEEKKMLLDWLRHDTPDCPSAP